MKTKSASKSLVDSAFEEMARQAVQGVIAENWGYGVDTEVKLAIKDVAQAMVREDQELRKMIRDRLVYWIAQS